MPSGKLNIGSSRKDLGEVVDLAKMAKRWKAKEEEALKEMRKRVQDVLSARIQFPEGKFMGRDVL